MKYSRWQKLRRSTLKRLGYWRKIYRVLLKFLGEALFYVDRERIVFRTISAADFDISMRHVRIVSGWGLIYACDLYCKVPEERRVHMEYLQSLPDSLSNLEPADDANRAISIFIKTEPSYVAYFASKVAPRLSRSFILVTGDSDYAIDNNFRNSIEQITRQGKFVAWYAQNLNFKHDRIFHLPIGLNYHSFWHNVDFWREGRYIHPMHQEAELFDVLMKSKSFKEREIKAYCNWHFFLDRGDRQRCLQEVHPEARYLEPERVSRLQTWINQCIFGFVISPEGAGMDCHRTWEAIALGSIPILKKNPVTPVLEGLPAIIVDDWKEVTPAFLSQQAAVFQNMKFDYSKIWLAYWKGKFSESEIFVWPPMTIDEFRLFLTTGSLSPRIPPLRMLKAKK